MPDTPLGPIGEILGLGVDDPEFPPDEIVVWAAKANRFQGIRAVGGRIYLTDRRLVFTSNNFERNIGGRAWSAPLADFERAFVKGPMKTVRVVYKTGGEEKFVISPRKGSAERIDRAIKAAHRLS
jgi:hypothetical protein